MAAALSLPDAAAAQIARAVQRAEKPILLWLEFQDCAGNTESFLRASRPSAAEVILDILSVDYHETIMAAAGVQAEQNLNNAVKQHAGSYIAVIEGSIPTGANGAYCTIGGRAAIDIARESAVARPRRSQSGHAHRLGAYRRRPPIRRAPWA